MPSRPEPFGLRTAPRIALEFLLVVAAVGVLVYTLIRLQLVVLPVIVALFATTALLPIHRWLRAHGVPSALSALMVMTAAILALAGVLTLIVPPFVDEVGDVGTQARGGIDEITRWLEEGPLEIDRQEIDQGVDRAITTVSDNAGGIGENVLTGATVVLEIVAGLLVALVLTFFFLHDGTRMWRWVLSLVPARHRDAVHAYGLDVLRTLGGYLRGVLVVAVADAALIGAGLALLGVPLVVPLMVLTFLAAFIPLVGAFTAGAVAALVALVSNGAVDAALVVVLVTVVQQIEGDVLYPMVVGRAIELHPVAILLAVLVGAVLYGIIGAALAVPLAAVAWAGVRRFRRQELMADTGVVLVEAPEP